MLTQVGYHVRGATVHAEAACAVSARRINLHGPHLPADPSGYRAPWRPCHWCGPRLITALAVHGPADAAWMLALYPTTTATRSWQLIQRPFLRDMLTALASAADLLTLTSDPDQDGQHGTVAFFGALPHDAVAPVGTMLRVHPLPARAVTQQVTKPEVFAATARVYARLLDADPTAGRHDDRTAPDLATWAEQRWTVAEGVAAPRLEPAAAT